MIKFLLPNCTTWRKQSDNAQCRLIPPNLKENEMKSFVVISAEYSAQVVGVFETLEKCVEYISKSKSYFRELTIEKWEDDKHLAIWLCDPYDLKPKSHWQVE